MLFLTVLPFHFWKPQLRNSYKVNINIYTLFFNKILAQDTYSRVSCSIVMVTLTNITRLEASGISPFGENERTLLVFEAVSDVTLEKTDWFQGLIQWTG